MQINHKYITIGLGVTFVIIIIVFIIKKKQ